ncbi:MAG: hypothetical protein FWG93_01845 [Oscillospiraceae bacterium]|nr:hypothetical protein [Oscillospiraceae bacterium]
MKRTLAFVLVILLLAANMSAFARTSLYIGSHSAGVSPQGGGVVKVSVFVAGTHPRMTKIGFPMVSLYELNGSTWTLVAVQTSQYNPNATAGSHSYSFTYQGTAGKSYYASASFYAQDTTGSDTKNASSPTVTAT